MEGRASSPVYCVQCYGYSMTRRYEYRRRLPHYQHSFKAVFMTFATYRRWQLPAAARTVVLETCLYGDGKRFELHGVVVMPDHVHLVLTPLFDKDGPYSVAEITQVIKGASAHRINKLMSRVGGVWQEESFDRVLRKDEAIDAKVRYILQNPVRAGLAPSPSEYPWLWEESGALCA